MAEKTQKTAFGVLAVAAVLVLGWLVWRQVSGSPDADQVPRTFLVLCANPKCQYSGEVEPNKLIFPGGGQKRPARTPAIGPGYKCPKCGQDTLYTEPMKCDACGTLFLGVTDASGASVRKCPKCGKVQ